MKPIDFFHCVSIVYDFTGSGKCCDDECLLGETCICNWSILDIIVCEPLINSHASELVDASKEAGQIEAATKLITIFEMFNQILADASLCGIVVGITDIVLNTTGRICLENTKCTLILIGPEGCVTELNNHDFSKTDNFVECCDFIKKYTIEKSMAKKSIRRKKNQEISSLRQGMYDERHTRENPNDSNELQDTQSLVICSLENHEELRTAMFQRQIQPSIQMNDIMAEGIGNIWYNWLGKRKTCEKSMMVLDHEQIESYEPPYDKTDFFENGMIGVCENESKQNGQVAFVLPLEIVFQIDGQNFTNFLVSGNESMILKKTIPHQKDHRMWSLIDTPMYSVHINTPPDSEENKTSKLIPFGSTIIILDDYIHDIRKSKREIMIRANIRAEKSFTIHFPMKIMMFLELYSVFDDRTKRNTNYGKWSLIQNLGTNEKYILFLLFPQETATGLIKTLAEQERWIVQQSGANADTTNRDIIQELRDSNIHALFVSIAPALATLRSLCVDLLLRIFMVSTGVYLHREDIHELIYTIQYMHTMIQKKNSLDLDKFAYGSKHLSTDKLHAIQICQQMHINFKKIILSEIITDVTNDIMRGGYLRTYDENPYRKVINMNSVEDDVKQEVLHRVANSLEIKSRQELEEPRLKKMMYLLQRNCGIYRRSDADERVYNLRSAIIDSSQNVPQCVLKALVRVFIVECSKKCLFEKSPIGNGDDSHCNEVFSFLQHIRDNIDSQVLVMLRSHEECILKEEAEYLIRMDDILKKKRIRVV